MTKWLRGCFHDSQCSYRVHVWTCTGAHLYFLFPSRADHLRVCFDRRRWQFNFFVYEVRAGRSSKLQTSSGNIHIDITTHWYSRTAALLWSSSLFYDFARVLIYRSRTKWQTLVRWIIHPSVQLFQSPNDQSSTQWTRLLEIPIKSDLIVGSIHRPALSGAKPSLTDAFRKRCEIAKKNFFIHVFRHELQKKKRWSSSLNFCNT